MLQAHIENITVPEIDRLPGRPAFTQRQPALDELRQVQTGGYDDLIVVGNGGSVTTFRGLTHAHNTAVRTHIDTSMEPARLQQLQDRTDPASTLVVAVSKSGETRGVLESLQYFLEAEYPAAAVTTDHDSTLRDLVAEHGLDVWPHPDIGGRFSGGTMSALLPATLAGIDVEPFVEGLHTGYNELWNTESPVARFGTALHELEQDGVTDVFAPVYSYRLFGYHPLLVQLIHETYCKEGRGQTVFGDLGPECQHHTIQRVFGGRDDVALFPIVQQDHASLKAGGQDLGDAFRAEYRGVRETAIDRGRPLLELDIRDSSPQAQGRLVAFMQLLAYLSAELRGLDPFDQPDVEQSKQLGIRYRQQG